MLAWPAAPDSAARCRASATDGHCTHEQTLLCDGLVMGAVIGCPRHNGRFDYTSGRALGAPVLTDVRTYPVRVTDGTVYLNAG